MSEQDGNVEQRDAAGPPKRKNGIRIRIEIGKRFCIFVIALAVLIAGVFAAARFVPRGTPVGVYRARQYAYLHDGANAMFVVTADYTCFLILYDEEGGPANAGGANAFQGTWKQEEDGRFVFTFEFDDGSPPTIIIGRSYWGGLKMKPGDLNPGQPSSFLNYEFFLPRMLFGFL